MNPSQEENNTRVSVCIPLNPGESAYLVCRTGWKFREKKRKLVGFRRQAWEKMKTGRLGECETTPIWWGMTELEDDGGIESGGRWVSKLTSVVGLLYGGLYVCLMTSKIQAIMKEQEKRTVSEWATLTGRHTAGLYVLIWTRGNARNARVRNPI